MTYRPHQAFEFAGGRFVPIVPDILLSNTLISDALCNLLPPPVVLKILEKKSFQLLQVSYKKLRDGSVNYACLRFCIDSI